MIYELRQYAIEPTLLDEYLAWANDRALPFLTGTFGFRLVGFWRVTGSGDETPPGPINVVWLIAWQSETEMRETWTRVRSSPAWQAIREGLPPYWRERRSVVLQPIPYSPLQ